MFCPSHYVFVLAQSCTLASRRINVLGDFSIIFGNLCVMSPFLRGIGVFDGFEEKIAAFMKN